MSRGPDYDDGAIEAAIRDVLVHPPTLVRLQHAAIDLIVHAHASPDEVTRRLGLKPDAMFAWMRSDVFRSALEQARRERGEHPCKT